MSKAKQNTKQILLIDKTGVVKETTMQIDSLPTLYRKAGLKSAEGFQEQFVWDIALENQKYTISLYAKKSGRLVKNIYGFPPPLEDMVFYGTCILVCQERGLDVKTWDSLFETIYEKYDSEELNDEEEGDDDESDEEEANEQSDDEEVDEADDEVEADDEDVVDRKANKKKVKKMSTNTLDHITCDMFESYLDCSSELTFEKYID